MPRTAPLQRAAAALVTAVAAAGLSAAPASAAWSSPTTLGPSAFESFPEVVVDDQGNATAVWVQHDEQFVTSLRARRRPAGGQWGPEQVLLQGTPELAVQRSVDAEVAGDGRVTVAYLRDSRTEQGHVVVETTSAPADGPFADVHAHNPEGGEDGFGEAEGPGLPELAAGPDGALALTWAHGLGFGSPRTFVRVVRRPAGGAWGAPEALSASTGRVRDLRAVVGPQGETTVAWRATCDSGANASCLDTLVSRTGPAGGAFSAPQDIAAVSTDSAGGVGQLVVDAAGTTTAAWLSAGASGSSTVLRAARRPAGGAWDGGQQLADRVHYGGGGTSAVGMAVAADGTVAVAWPELSEDFVRSRPMVARRTAAGWQSAEDASGGAPPRQLSTVALAGNGSGALLAVWNGIRGAGEQTTYFVDAALRGGTGFSAPAVVSEIGYQDGDQRRPAAALAPDGSAFATWDLTGTGPQVSDLEPGPVDPGPVPGGDAESPQVTITTPASGQRFTQGQAVTADYACTDDVGVTLCQGNVADGARLDTGTVGEHRFTVIAQDAAGRTTTRTHGYVVDAPAATTPATTPNQPQQQQPVTPAPRPTAPAAAQGAQAAQAALGGSAAKAVAGTPKAVPAATVIKTGVTLPVFTARPGTEVAGGLAGLIGTAAGNLIGQAAGNLIGQAAGNLIGPAAGNLISDNGLGVVAAGGANLRGASTAGASPFRAAAAKPRLALLGKGGTFLARPGAGKVKVKLTKQGKAVLRKAFRKKGRQKVKLTYVLVLGQRGAGLPAVFGSRTITIRE